MYMCYVSMDQEQRVGRSLLTSPIRRIHALLLCAATQKDKPLLSTNGEQQRHDKKNTRDEKNLVFDSSNHNHNTYQIIPYRERCGALVGHQTINIPIPKRPSLHRLTQNPVGHEVVLRSAATQSPLLLGIRSGSGDGASASIFLQRGVA